jgi:hypothetical protein
MEWSFQIEGFRFQNFLQRERLAKGAFSRGRERGAEAGFKRVRGFLGVSAMTWKEVAFCNFKSSQK